MEQEGAAAGECICPDQVGRTRAMSEDLDVSHDDKALLHVSIPSIAENRGPDTGRRGAIIRASIDVLMCKTRAHGIVILTVLNAWTHSRCFRPIFATS